MTPGLSPEDDMVLSSREGKESEVEAEDSEDLALGGGMVSMAGLQRAEGK